MIRYILKRLLLMIPVLFGITLLVFSLQFITPGDPARLVLGNEATPEDIEMWHQKNGLDKPFVVQFGEYIFGIVTRGDLGLSWKNGQSISAQIAARWPTTCKMAIVTTLVSVLIGVPLGIVSANHRGKFIDAFSRIFGMVGISLPYFWFALMMILLFAVKLKWLPVSGFYGPEYVVLPACTLGMLRSASILRVTRSSMLDNINADFVRTARAKGQDEKAVTRLILKNALIPIITSVGTCFATNMSGMMILEQIFAIPGLGTLMVQSINSRDFPQLRASILLVAVTVSVVNLLTDIAYAAVDPRVKASFKSKVKSKPKKQKGADAA